MATRTKKVAAVAAVTASAEAVAAVQAPEPVVAGPVLKKKDLVDRVAEKSGMKKKDVKPAVEALLAVLGEALLKGEECILPPLGKLKVARTKEVPNGAMLTVKVRQTNPGEKTAAAPLADDEE